MVPPNVNISSTKVSINATIKDRQLSLFKVCLNGESNAEPDECG